MYIGKLGDGSDAEARLRLVFADYGNSYYGRLASRHLPRTARSETMSDAIPATRQTPADPPAEPPTANLIRLLLTAGLYDDALNELRFAQRTVGTSSSIEATIAWAYHQKGELRRAITLMRRAYPQFMAAGGEGLPREVLTIIFPLAYWDLIQKYSSQHDLDHAWPNMHYLITSVLEGRVDVTRAWRLREDRSSFEEL